LTISVEGEIKLSALISSKDASCESSSAETAGNFINALGIIQQDSDGGLREVNNHHR
jgi:hypothetical protein